MKKLLSLLVMALLVTSVMPAVMGVSVGTGITPDIETEDFPPMVWMCDSRIVLDDFTEPGRLVDDVWCTENCNQDEEDDLEGFQECIEDCREELSERKQNYAFEGEQIQWEVLVLDKNGIEKLEDVFATIGDTQGEGNDMEVNCDFLGVAESIEDSCNARILEEELGDDEETDFSQIAGYWECTLTVETPISMYGEYWITVEATDLDGLSGTMDENEYWFLNPVVALTIDGDLSFEDVRPGTSSYSDTLLVENDADSGSGVMLDMFISGTDFYDSSSSGAMCPTSNLLSLGSFDYFATNGAYSTEDDDRSDDEGYVGINYGIGFNDPNPFYNHNEIMQVSQGFGGYYYANILSPGSEMALTFRLSLPEPCNGDFDTGSIYFWGEAS